MKEKTPLVVDTDMGNDDWLAIVYLLNRLDVDLQAITITGAGLSTCDAGFNDVYGLLSLAKHSQVPVACGRSVPLRGNHSFPEIWRISKSTLDTKYPPSSNVQSVSVSAAELFANTLQSSDRKMIVLALGPLTNVAEAFEATPSLVDNIQMVYIMGGAVRTPGNLGADVAGNEKAEWNIYVDPYAAGVVFKSGVPITLIPLDATNVVPVTRAFCERLRQSMLTPSAKFVYEALMSRVDSIDNGEFFFWDPLAAAVVTDESIVHIGETRLTVVDDGGVFSGWTREDQDGNTIRVAFGARAPQFEELFLTTLNNVSS